MTQEDLAHKAGMSVRAIGHWERSEAPLKSSGTLRRLAAALDTTADELLAAWSGEGGNNGHIARASQADRLPPADDSAENIASAFLRLNRMIAAAEQRAERAEKRVEELENKIRLLKEP